MAYPPQQPGPPGWGPPPGMVPPPRRPRTGLVVGIVVAVLVVVAGVVTWVLWPSEPTPTAAPASTTSSTPPPVTTTTVAPVSCVYTPTPDQPAARNVGVPQSTKVPASGTVQATLKTNLGDIPITLDRAGAPCAVHNFLFLIKQKYYDGVPCHRVTLADRFRVLQCGDPTGTGRGGPGYQFDDKLPTGLVPAGSGAAVHPRGTVAMANAGPGTNGSQFFLVYRDSQFAPDYPLLGHYDPAGQSAIEQVAAGGITAAPDDPQAQDGIPATPMTISQATAQG